MLYHLAGSCLADWVALATLINKIPCWQKSPRASGWAFREPLLCLISLFGVPPFSHNYRCFSPSWRLVSWLNWIAPFWSFQAPWLVSGRGLAWWMYCSHSVSLVRETLKELLGAGNLGKEGSGVMEKQREEQVLGLWAGSFCANILHLTLDAKSRTKAVLFLTFFPWFLLSQFLSLLYFSFFLFFFLYSVWEIVVDASVLGFRSSLRPAPNVFYTGEVWETSEELSLNVPANTVALLTGSRQGWRTTEYPSLKGGARLSRREESRQWEVNAVGVSLQKIAL